MTGGRNGEWAIAPGVDPDRPSIARTYDYYLGGAHNFAVDRELAERAKRATPHIEQGARELRRFLVRAVRACAHDGLDQYLDLGAGIPTVATVHDTARAIVPDARVAYVDHDAVAVAHSHSILDGVAGTSVTMADLRDPAAVLAAPSVAGVLDFSRPVVVLLLGVLHFVGPDRDVAGIVAAYRDHLAPASRMVLSHTSDDVDDPALGATIRGAVSVYRDTAQPLHSRSFAEIEALFAGMTPEPPGVVEVTRWRPTGQPPSPIGVYGGIGRVDEA